jgi:type II secretory pathway component GspD/PulD (secretin)
MRADHQMARTASLLFVMALLAAVPGTVKGRSMAFPTGSYAYVVIDQDLRDLLTEFGHSLNVVVQLSDEVHGRMRGPLPTSTAQEFLDRICERSGLVWYYDGSGLFISAQSELRTEVIDIGKVPPKAMSDKLSKLDIVDPRFPVTVTAEPAMLSVSGPPSYLSRLRETVTLLVRSLARPVEMGDDDRVRVFRGGS